jgi:spore maturation protein CgeB
MSRPLTIAVFGLSLSSSWGNGHATTYRALLAGLARRGHRIIFFERRQPWYAQHRDLATPDYCELVFYDSVAELAAHRSLLMAADVRIVGSYVPDGVAVGLFVHGLGGVSAFYDIDTPVTLAALRAGQCAYLSAIQIPAYDLYLSFTGGPTLDELEERYGARHAAALYCSVDPALYRPLPIRPRWDLGYLGTYSDDRQPTLQRLLLDVAERAPELNFVVAGALYPGGLHWPENVTHIEHVAPAEHASFYAHCRWSLNVTRADMRAAGHSPSVRLFEAAACGSALISDRWPGLDALLDPDGEIALVEGTDDVLAILREWPDERRSAQAARARERVLAEHTGDVRAGELEALLHAALKERQQRMGSARSTAPRPAATPA